MYYVGYNCVVCNFYFGLSVLPNSNISTKSKPIQIKFDVKKEC